MSRTNRYGEVIWFGFSLWVIAAAIESRFSRDFPLAGIIVTLIAQGMGVGFTFQPSEFYKPIFLLPFGKLADWSCAALVAAQAHSAKQDRAVVISSRNFLRALGGAAGLAIASALFSNTLVGHLNSITAIPANVADEIKSSVFSMPDISGLREEQKIIVLDTYTKASRSVFYFWEGCMGLCWLLMFFIKDKGLQRKEETHGNTVDENRRADEESGSITVSGDEGVSARAGEKADDLNAASRHETERHSVER